MVMHVFIIMLSSSSHLATSGASTILIGGQADLGQGCLIGSKNIKRRIPVTRSKRNTSKRQEHASIILQGWVVVVIYCPWQPTSFSRIVISRKDCCCCWWWWWVYWGCNNYIPLVSISRNTSHTCSICTMIGYYNILLLDGLSSLSCDCSSWCGSLYWIIPKE